MKAIAALLAVVMLMALMPLAIAEEVTDKNSPEPILIAKNPETVEDDQTLSVSDLNEIKHMDNPLGIKVRLLQLEKRITRNNLVGTQVIVVINANHPDENTGELEQLNSKLKTLITETQSLLSQTLAVKDASAEYVSIKKEAITTTQEFRAIATAILTAEDRKQIAKKVKNLDGNELKSINSKIKSFVRNYNAQKIENFLSKLGVDKNELGLLIRKGKLSQEQIRERIMQKYKDANAQQKQVIMKQIQQNIIRKNVAQKAAIDHIKSNIAQKIQSLRKKIEAIKSNQKGKGGN